MSLSSCFLFLNSVLRFHNIVIKLNFRDHIFDLHDCFTFWGHQEITFSKEHTTDLAYWYKAPFLR